MSGNFLPYEPCPAFPAKPCHALLSMESVCVCVCVCVCKLKYSDMSESENQNKF